ncbi:MAG: hypothetical protein LUE95_06615, partial [Oscillospiraceae bacterium]|nr:hypothetical protein [Oscillospiraceae bacterium]
PRRSLARPAAAARAAKNRADLRAAEGLANRQVAEDWAAPQVDGVPAEDRAAALADGTEWKR